MASASERDSSNSSTMHFFHLCTTTIIIALMVTLSLALLGRARSRKNPMADRLPPGPSGLLFLAKFLAMRRTILDDLTPLLRDLHARYGPVVSLRLSRTLLVFISDRRLAHSLLVQGGTTFADRTPPVDLANLFTFGGYTVPRGTEVNFLTAEIGRDETVWTSAREFWPDRFLDGGEGYDVDITGTREIKMMPFGAGRRMCPGYFVGIHHAEYFVARMVRDLEWRLSVDGVAVDMAEALDATVVMKQPLRARIFARPELHE